MLGPVAAHRAIGGSCPLSPGSGPLQDLLPPEPLHPFVVHASARMPQQAVVHAPVPADVLSCDLAETMTQLSVLDRGDLDRMALGAALLIGHTADQTLRGPVMLLQDRDLSAATFQAQRFPSATSLSIAFSSSASSRSFLLTGVLLPQLSQPLGLLGLHPAVLLPPTEIRRRRSRLGQSTARGF